MDQHQVEVYLVNTGWTGGPVGIGNRMKLSHTRAMVTAALNGSLRSVSYETDPVFGFSVPVECPDVPSTVLTPRKTWSDPKEYDLQAQKLALQFTENFNQKFPQEVALQSAGPRV